MAMQVTMAQATAYINKTIRMATSAKYHPEEAQTVYSFREPGYSVIVHHIFSPPFMGNVYIMLTSPDGVREYHAEYDDIPF